MISDVTADDTADAIHFPTASWTAGVLRIIGKGEVSCISRPWLSRGYLRWRLRVYGSFDSVLSFGIVPCNLYFLQEKHCWPFVPPQEFSQ